MTGMTTGTATACWTSLGFLVHLTVTEPGALPAARELLEAAGNRLRAAGAQPSASASKLGRVIEQG